MSALAHMIESRGVATVAIGLVRMHMEKTRPPRGLWVPFPLGRPLGEPEDAAFQTRVLQHALGLLARTDGPVVLDDFAEDAPSMRDVPGWRPQVALPASRAPASAEGWIDIVAAELAALKPAAEAARRRFGRTTVGISRLAPEAWAPFVVSFITGDGAPNPFEGVSPNVALRYVADDMKAYYMEAAQAAGPQPSSLQVLRWFWNETQAAELLRAVRAVALDSPHNGLKTVGTRFLVPAPFVVRAAT